MASGRPKRVNRDPGTAFAKPLPAPTLKLWATTCGAMLGGREGSPFGNRLSISHPRTRSGVWFLTKSALPSRSFLRSNSLASSGQGSDREFEAYIGRTVKKRSDHAEKVIPGLILTNSLLSVLSHYNGEQPIANSQTANC